MALYTVSGGAALAALDVNQLYNLLSGIDTSTQLTVSNAICAMADGASYPQARYVGGTTGGAPTSGTFAAGDFIVDQLGFMWVCATAGSPGTWRRQGGGDYGCIAIQTTAQSITSRSSQVGFDAMNLSGIMTTSSDPHSMFQSGTHNIKVPLAGYYQVSGCVGTTGATASWSQATVLTKNGTVFARGSEMPVQNGGNMVANDIVLCAVNDTIGLGVYAEHACNANTGAGQIWLSVYLVG